MHHNSLATLAEAKRADAAYKHKEELITKAKAAYAQSKLPDSQKSADGKSKSFAFHLFSADPKKSRWVVEEVHRG